ALPSFTTTHSAASAGPNGLRYDDWLLHNGCFRGFLNFWSFWGSRCSPTFAHVTAFAHSSPFLLAHTTHTALTHSGALFLAHVIPALAHSRALLFRHIAATTGAAFASWTLLRCRGSSSLHI